jgi:hypothetical protein
MQQRNAARLMRSSGYRIDHAADSVYVRCMFERITNVRAAPACWLYRLAGRPYGKARLRRAMRSGGSAAIRRTS